MPVIRLCSHVNCTARATGRCFNCAKPACQQHSVTIRVMAAANSRRERVCLACLEDLLHDPGNFGAVRVALMHDGDMSASPLDVNAAGADVMRPDELEVRSWEPDTVQRYSGHRIASHRMHRVTTCAVEYDMLNSRHVSEL